jgi:hypothetical protein
MHKMLELADPEIKQFGITLIANKGHPSQEMEDLLENITLRM